MYEYTVYFQVEMRSDFVEPISGSFYETRSDFERFKHETKHPMRNIYSLTSFSTKTSN